MASTFQIPQITLPVGSGTFGPATVPDADSRITVSIDRTVSGGLNSLTAASVLAMLAEMSTDGGSTWHAVDTLAAGTETAWETGGGDLSGTNPRTGQPVGLVSSGTWSLAPGTGRRVRATVTVSGPSSIAVAGSIATQ